MFDLVIVGDRFEFSALGWFRYCQRSDPRWRWQGVMWTSGGILLFRVGLVHS